jgi:hypothetical protein
MHDLREAFVGQHFDATRSNIRIVETKPAMEFDLKTSKFYAPQVKGPYLHFTLVLMAKNKGATNEGTVKSLVKMLASCDHFGNEHIPTAINETSEPGFTYLTVENDNPGNRDIFRPAISAYAGVTLPQVDSKPADDGVVRVMPAVDTIVPIEFLFAYNNVNNYHIKVRNDLAKKLRGFIDAANGFPSSLDGNFLRMLYLSTTTITTLGYGDIVPLTTTARLLIALESILGIILIGAFLNALATEMRVNQPPP